MMHETEVVDALERTYRDAIERYILSDELSPAGQFLGLANAPVNNIEYYAQREAFANWLMDQDDLFPKATNKRTQVPMAVVVARMQAALGIRGYSLCEFYNAMLKVMLCESRLRNAGFGRDRHGRSNACGYMQTKWCAVMDGGYRYENYLDIVFDRAPLIGVDAGVGYFVRMFNRTDGTLEERLNEAICCYNRPGTNPSTNEEYFEAVQRMSEHIHYERFAK